MMPHNTDLPNQVGIKKRRFRASFSVLRLKDGPELCVGAITQRPGGRGAIAASNLKKW